MAGLAETDLTAASDETLVELIRQQDRNAEGVLLSRYFSLVHQIAYRHCGILDFDDLAQEGCIGLLDAIASFDPQKDAAFRTYASVCIRNRMLKALEKAKSGKALVLSQSLSLEELDEDAPSDALTPEQAYLARERLDSLLADIDRVLSPLERRVLFAHLGGFDYQTIASTLHISPKSVDNALQRVRKKLKTIVQP